MRITFRHTNNKDYCTHRWADIPADDPMDNLNVFPLKYSELIIKKNEGPILEAGCGVDQFLRYYHDLGHDIIGIDFF